MTPWPAPTFVGRWPAPYWSPLAAEYYDRPVLARALLPVRHRGQPARPPLAPRGEAGDDPENPLVIVCEGCDPEKAAEMGIQHRQLALLERIAVALERLAGSAPEA